MATTPRKTDSETPTAKVEAPKNETPNLTRLPSVEPGPPADALADDAAVAATQKAVADKMQSEWDRGYRGTAVDPTPNENYTLAGVTNPDKHVPEEFKTRTGTIVYPAVHPDAAK